MESPETTVTSPSTPPEPSPAPPPEAAPPPARVKVASPPPPDVPSRPRTRRAPRPSALAQVEPVEPPAAPVSKWRELPTDPEARERCRALVRIEAQGLVGLLGTVAQMFPPGRPFAEEEAAMLQTPVEDVVYKYGANLDPLVSLAIALGAVATIRWVEWKKTQSATPSAGA